MTTIKRMNELLRYLCTALLITMTSLVVFQVISRKYLHISVAEVEELARYCMIWVALLGAAIGIQTKTHVAVEIIQKKFKATWQTPITLFVYLCMGLLLLIFVYFGTPLCLQAMTQRSPSMPFLRIGFVMSVVPISGLIGLINLAGLAVEALRAPQEEGGEDHG